MPSTAPPITLDRLPHTARPALTMALPTLLTPASIVTAVVITVTALIVSASVPRRVTSSPRVLRLGMMMMSASASAHHWRALLRRCGARLRLPSALTAWVLGQTLPRSVNYHMTRNCNYACRFCFHTATAKDVLSVDDAKEGLRRLKAAGMEKVPRRRLWDCLFD